MLRYVLLFASLDSTQVQEWESHKYLTCEIYFWRFFCLCISRAGPHCPCWRECPNWASCIHRHLQCSSKSCCNSWEVVYQAFQILLRISEPTILNKEGSPITLHSPKISLILPMWTSVSNLYKNSRRGISLNCSYNPLCCQCHSLTMDIMPTLPLSLGRVQIY